jgi:hypothetical protein
MAYQPTSPGYQPTSHAAPVAPVAPAAPAAPGDWYELKEKCWAGAGKSLERAGFRARMDSDLTNAQIYYQRAAEAFDKAGEPLCAANCWEEAASLAECMGDKMYDERETEMRREG